MTKTPTVILDECCANLATAVKEFAPTYVFKRPSGYLSVPSTTVDELRAALASEKLEPPYILVTLSFGSFAVLLYSQAFPETVAGIVLVDPSHPKQEEAVLRILPPLTEDTPVSIVEFRRFIRGFGPIWDRGCQQALSVRSLHDLPLTLLAAGRPEMPAELETAIQATLIRDRHAQLKELAALSSRGEMRVVPNTGHDITRLAPDVVVDAIKRILLSVGQEETDGLTQSVLEGVTPRADANPQG